MLRQWFVCPICFGVILAYPKSVAASQAMRRFWNARVRPAFPHLRLVETEPMRLQPYVPGSRRARTKTVAVLDFAVFDDKAGAKQPIFYIEMKAGPGAIDEMDQFQLDVNDSNDVAIVCNASGVPCYIFHVQVIEEYQPPTRRALAKAAWWTDCFALQGSLQAVKARRGEEDKKAGYYAVSAFQAMDEFIVELRKRAYLRLRKRLLRSPLRRR